ncbi:hypothetical protein [Calidifontibacillus erzurumensis]|uniref:hypothetical protein n=1 Tax=Calidifontibacillus erzurumensis TaxID=2741433 RepID=UPI0035B5361C
MVIVSGTRNTNDFYNLLLRLYQPAAKILNGDVAGLPDLDTKELAKENEKLKTLLGEKDLEIAILRDLIKKKNPHLLKNLK